MKQKGHGDNQPALELKNARHLLGEKKWVTNMLQAFRGDHSSEATIPEGQAKSIGFHVGHSRNTLDIDAYVSIRRFEQTMVWVVSSTHHQHALFVQARQTTQCFLKEQAPRRWQ